MADSQFSVTLFKNDGKKRASDARFAMVDLRLSLALGDLGKAFAERIYDGEEKIGHARLFTLRGVPIDDLAFLSPNMDVVVSPNGEDFLSTPKAIEEQDFTTEDGQLQHLCSTFNFN
jgi:hypothetical protein